MNDPLPSETAARRPRVGLVITTLVVLAFVVGIALMLVAMRNSGGWFVRTPSAAQPAPEGVLTQPAPQPEPQPSPQVTVPPTPEALDSRETTLAAQLSALDTRTASIDSTTAAAAAQAGRAEAMMVAFAARRAIDRGRALGYLEVQLRERFGQIAAGPVATVIQAARQPVTVAALRQALDANADRLTNGGGDGWVSGWLAGIRHQFGSLIILHDVNTPSQLPAERLARARRLLDAAQVEAALAEVSRLPGAGSSGNWANAARRFIAAHRALDALEAAALMVPPPAPTDASSANNAPPAPVTPPAHPAPTVTPARDAI